MNMKRVISLFLCLVMLLATVSILASCNGEKDPGEEDPGEEDKIKLSETTHAVDLSKYTVIYARSVSDHFKSRVMDFTTIIADSIGSTSVRNKPDGGDASNGNYEIIVGTSVRNESVQALNSISGNGWTINVVPTTNKVIIMGSTEFLTTVAMDYFVLNYLAADALNGTVSTIHESVKADDIAMLELVQTVTADNGTQSLEGTFSVVYGENVDDNKGGKNAAGTRDYGSDGNHNGLDYIFTVADELKSQVVTSTRAKQATMPLRRDNEEIKTTNELLVGRVNRTEMQEELDKLTVNQYALVVRGNKVMLVAHNDTTLASAYALASAMLNMSTKADAAGNKTVIVPAEYYHVETIDEDKWVTDFPKPDNVALISNMDVGSNALCHVYTGEGVSREGFVAYCEKLEAEGYTVLSAETQMSDSSFVTYMHSGKDIVLHVSHAAHKYAETEGVDEFVEALRVVSMSTDYVTVDKSLFNEDRTWIKKTDSMITQYEMNRAVGAWGNSIVMTLEDGSFMVFDGGHKGQTGDSNDEDLLYNVLYDLYEKVHGKEPTSENPIRISAWMISHEHGDHFGVFNLFCREYGPSNLVTIERLLYNFSSDDENYNSCNPETFIRTRMEELQGKADNFDAIKVHSGEKYYIANAEIHILYTHEDIYPQRVEFFNSSSTVFDISFGTTPAEKLGTTVGAADIVNTESLILLGDLERVGSRCLRSMYSTDMAADQVQVSHHGYNGCEEKLYQNINPEVVWWPTSNSQFNGQTKASFATSTNWINAANYGVAYEIANVKMIIVQDDFNTTLTLTETGPDFENLYDAYKHRVIEKDTTLNPGYAGSVIYRP